MSSTCPPRHIEIDEQADTSKLQGVPPSEVLHHLRMTDPQFAAGWNTAMAYLYSGEVPCALCKDQLFQKKIVLASISLAWVTNFIEWSKPLQIRCAFGEDGQLQILLREPEDE